MRVFSLKSFFEALTLLWCLTGFAQNESPSSNSLNKMVNGPCAAKTLGGFSRSETVNDGRVRLTRLKRITDPGHLGGPEGKPLYRVLELKESEIVEIWTNAHLAGLTKSELEELARLCNEESSSIKSAQHKMAMQGALKTTSEMAKRGIAAFTNPAVVPAENLRTNAPPLLTLTGEEESALLALTKSELAQSALKKINTSVKSNIDRLFEVLNLDRGYDVNFSSHTK